jgi:hypothetical protein
VNRYFSILLSLFFISTSLSAQGQTLAIGRVKACAGEIVLLPVNAGNLTDVGAITLFINFDSLLIEYLNLENIDPQLDNINYGYNEASGQIVIAWSNISGRTFIQNKFFDIKFKLSGCTGSSVGFAPGSEIAKKDLQIVPVVMSNGAVDVDLPEIASQPEGVNVKTGAKAIFTLNASPVTEYLWKESSDQGVSWQPLIENEKYHGVCSTKLEISPVTLADNNNLYLCELNNKGCKINTNQAPLSVDTLNAINDHANNGAYDIKIFPNPFQEKITCSFNITEKAGVIIDIIDMAGKTVLTLPLELTGGRHFVEISAGFLSPGIYQCRILLPGESLNAMSYWKIIKL